MTLFINNKSKDGLAKLGGKISESSCVITFSEATYKLDESGNFGTLSFVYFSSTDTKPIGENLPIEVGQITQLKFTIKDYESKYQDRTDKKVASAKEIAWHDVLTKVQAEHEAFSGFIDLSQPPLMIIAKGTGKNNLGVDLDPSFLTMLAGQVCEFTGVALTLLANLPESQKKQYGGGNRGQSEKERLADRLAFLEAFCTENQLPVTPMDKLAFILGCNPTATF
jgi:hypothetical protein